MGFIFSSYTPIPLSQERIKYLNSAVLLRFGHTVQTKSWHLQSIELNAIQENERISAKLHMTLSEFGMQFFFFILLLTTHKKIIFACSTYIQRIKKHIKWKVCLFHFLSPESIYLNSLMCFPGGISSKYPTIWIFSDHDSFHKLRSWDCNVFDFPITQCKFSSLHSGSRQKLSSQINS